MVSGAEESITGAIDERIRTIRLIQTTQTTHDLTDPPDA